MGDRRGLLVWLFLLLGLGACRSGASPLPTPLSPHETQQPSPSVAPSGVHITDLWAYTDTQRLGLEFRIAGYPLPAEADLDPHFFPITRVDLVRGDRRIPLYRNPILTLDAYHALFPQVHLYLAWENRRTRQTDFRLSFAYLEPDVDVFTTPWRLEVELGTFRIPTGPGTVLVLPAQGVLTAPISFATAATPRRTWGPEAPVQGQGLMAELQRVLVNPSVTWFDVCLAHSDRQAHWKPQGEIRAGGRRVPAIAWSPLEPGALPLSTLSEVPRRCFTITVPVKDTMLLAQPFEIGLREVVVEHADGHLLTLEACETARQQVEQALPGTRIRCQEFTVMQGQRQIWFDILAWPPESAREQVYNHMLDALALRLDQGWYWRLAP